jgi:AcrR family transcriptional regulator
MANVQARGRRRPRGRLSRDRILAAALRVIDEDGFGGLTMRRLAERLEADPMSLYNHFDGKEALLDGLTGTLWSEVEVGDGDWKQVLPALAIGVRRLAHAHPYAFRLVLSRGTWPVAALEPLDAALSALERAGLTREPAADMIRTLLAYAGGWAMLELSCAGATAPGTSELEQVIAMTRTLPADTPAHLVETARLMACCDMDLQFSLGLQLILDGLGARLDSR